MGMIFRPIALGLFFFVALSFLVDYSAAQYNETNYRECAFPFFYMGKRYDNCTTNDRRYLWCSKDTNFSGNWKYCVDTTITNWACKDQSKCNGRHVLQIVEKENVTYTARFGHCIAQNNKQVFCINEIFNYTESIQTPGDGVCPINYYRMSPQHTMCNKKSANVIVSGITEQDKSDILYLHNYFRRTTDLAAANMQRIYWDSELQKVAQKHADTCSFTHDAVDMRELYYAGHESGQNIVLTRNSILPHDWNTTYTEMFTGEEKMWEYGVGIIPKYKGKHAHHYIQGILASITRVGCGYAECLFAEVVERLYVCNYNLMPDEVQYKKPFIDGARCSSCPKFCYMNSLCDCGGLECLNNGELDPSTCKCKCSGFFKGTYCNETIKPVWDKAKKCYTTFILRGVLQTECATDEYGKFCSKTPILHKEDDIVECSSKKRKRTLTRQVKRQNKKSLTKKHTYSSSRHGKRLIKRYM